MDKERCESLYKEHYRSMYRYAYTMLNDTDDAMDVVSEVWVMLLQMDKQIVEDTAKGFLLKLVHNICVNKIKHLKVEERARRLLPMEIDIVADEWEVTERERKWNDVSSFMHNELTPQTVKILQMRYQDDLSYKDMAEALGVSTSAINKHITNALKKLRKHFISR